MDTKQQDTKEPKRINPVYEYLTKLRGQVIINDPTLLL